MAAQPVPKLFLSHSHVDKPVARRLVRRLTAHGIRVWLDERELRAGAALTPSIRAQIEGADALLVIASQASADSTWVGLELDFAREHGKTIIPFFIESLDKHQRFRDYLGMDATSPQMFADVVHGLMRDLFKSSDLELPAADPAALTAGLRELAQEEPGLAPLVVGCLESEGLHQENMDTVWSVPFHPLDDALDALFDLRPSSTIAYHAAYGFCCAGAGARALSSWIGGTGDGEMPLVTAVGSRTLQASLIPTAIKLLASCSPPNNHALYNFIHHNSNQLDEAQRRSMIRLVTWPVRTDTERFGDVLAWVAFKHFPDAMEIQQMWSRWIRAGVFDGKPSSPMKLAGYIADADKETLPGWGPIHEALRSHVRGFLRSGDKAKVVAAMDHVRAAADTGAPVLSLLLREADGVSATAEWNKWRDSDPDTAEWMQWYVFEVAQEAVGERDWLRAWKSAKETVARQKKFRQILNEEKQEVKRDG